MLTSPWRSLCGLGKRSEQPTPISNGIEDRAHFVATIAIAIQTPMLELDARAGISFVKKAHLYSRLQSWVILPVGGDIPGQHEPRGRLPSEHTAAVARASVVTALIPTAAHARFDDRIHCVGFADLVRRQRPPRPHLLCEDAPRRLSWRLHANNLADAVWIKRTRRDPLSYHHLPAFVALARPLPEGA